MWTKVMQSVRCIPRVLILQRRAIEVFRVSYMEIYRFSCHNQTAFHWMKGRELMSISIKCSHCGKGLKVPDDRVGKLAKCPGCGETFTVLPANSVVGGKPAKTSEQRFSEHAAVAIPTGLIIWIGVASAAVGLVGAVVFGPVRVWHEWVYLRPHALSLVEEVVTRGLQCYTSHQPWFNPKKSGFNAGVRDVSFYFLPYYVSMPEKVAFAGMSTQGKFIGTFFPHTGEVAIVAEVGGATFEGVSFDVRKAGGTIRITGRETNGQLSAEVDGQDATVVTSNPTTE